MSKKVLLTGISGYIGHHCAVELLKNGYSVRGSVRNLSKSKEVINSIKTKIDPKKKLEFCELDLLSDTGWDDAVQDCQYVMHVASPFINIEPKDESLYIKPAVDGTMRALKSAKNAGVKRVVLTSSMVSMLKNADKSILIDSESWTNVDSPNVSVTGHGLTITQGTATALSSTNPQPVGEDLQTALGTPTVVAVQNVNISVTGQALTSTLNNSGVVVNTNANVLLTPLTLISTELGNVTLQMNGDVNVTGLSMNIVSSTSSAVYTWTEVDDSETSTWTEVDDSATMTWHEAA